MNVIVAKIVAKTGVPVPTRPKDQTSLTHDAKINGAKKTVVGCKKPHMISIQEHGAHAKCQRAQVSPPPPCLPSLSVFARVLPTPATPWMAHQLPSATSPSALEGLDENRKTNQLKSMSMKMEEHYTLCPINATTQCL